MWIEVINCCLSWKLSRHKDITYTISYIILIIFWYSRSNISLVILLWLKSNIDSKKIGTNIVFKNIAIKNGYSICKNLLAKNNTSNIIVAGYLSRKKTKKIF